MLNAYEKRLGFTWLDNALGRAGRDHRAAGKLVAWVEANQSALGLKPASWPGPDFLDRLETRLRHREVALGGTDWRRFKAVIRAGRSRHERARPDRTARRLRSLGRMVGLGSADVAVLELLVRQMSHPVFDSLCDEVLDSVSRFGERHLRSLCAALPALLGLPVRRVRECLAVESPLVKCGLVAVDDDGDVRAIDRLQRLATVTAERQAADGDACALLLDAAAPSELVWEDFDHVAEQRDHAEKLLRGALAAGTAGVNVLVYGPPGTGKTAFCKVLAERLGAKLYNVGEFDDRGDEPSRHERLQELNLAQRLIGGGDATRRQALLLFDEMEDLLADPNAGLGFPLALFGRRRRRGSGGSKVYMNRLLEAAPTPTLWTTNGAEHTCPTVLRRMMYAIELRQPPPKVRARVWQRQLRQHGIDADAAAARALAAEFDASPGVAAGATAAARLAGGDLEAVRVGVRSLARLLHGDRVVQKPPQGFDIALVHADVDVSQLADSLTKSGERRFSLCLQGPPGSGKSAFVRHLADRLGMEVVLKRASDLLSMWVGGTERQIREAFAEAKDAEAILVFDEADSLLGDRRFAHRSWEVSQVNEMLTWMESHPLPFACTTNFGERLDSATLRRFTFKVTLSFLNAEQAERAFRGHFRLEPPTDLKRLERLTPADFAVVQRRAEVLACGDDAEALARMLGEECAAKPGLAAKPGF